MAHYASEGERLRLEEEAGIQRVAQLRDIEIKTSRCLREGFVPPRVPASSLTSTRPATSLPSERVPARHKSTERRQATALPMARPKPLPATAQLSSGPSEKHQKRNSPRRISGGRAAQPPSSLFGRGLVAKRVTCSAGGRPRQRPTEGPLRLLEGRAEAVEPRPPPPLSPLSGSMRDSSDMGGGHRVQVSMRDSSDMQTAKSPLATNLRPRPIATPRSGERRAAALHAAKAMARRHGGLSPPKTAEVIAASSPRGGSVGQGRASPIWDLAMGQASGQGELPPGARKVFQAPNTTRCPLSFEHQSKAPFEDIPHFQDSDTAAVTKVPHEQPGASREQMAETKRALLEALAGGRERSAKESRGAQALEEKANRLALSRMQGSNRDKTGREAYQGKESSQPGTELVVDAGGTGDFLDVASAVSCAKEGDVIVVLPGTYKGPIRVNHSIRLKGRPDMKKGSVILEHSGRESLLWATGPSTELEMEHLMLRHKGSKEQCFEHAALQVDAGASVAAMGCGLTCSDANGATVRGLGSKLVAKQSQVRDAGRCGIEVLQGATLVAEQCQVLRNGWSGVEVSTEATASVSRCTVAKNGMFGLHFMKGSRGKVERNSVSGHGAAFGGDRAGAKVEPGARVSES